MAAINHHTGKTFVDALLAEFKGISVVQMYCNRDIGETQRSLNELFQIYRIGVLPRAFGNLDHHGRLFLFTGLHNRLEEFHVVDVERADGVFAFERLVEQFSGVCQWHGSMTDPINTNRPLDVRTHILEIAVGKGKQKSGAASPVARPASAYTSSSSDNFRYNVARLISSRSAAFSLSPSVCARARFK